MLTLHALGAALVIVSVWFVGLPILLLASGVEPFELDLGAWRAAGAVPLAVGAGLFGWVTWVFAARGGGTPLVFAPPARLVLRGPFRWMRNPMYVADVLIIAGEAVLLEASIILAYAAALWGALHVLVVVLEEPRLRRRFGRSYAVYCERVPRWLPRLRAANERDEEDL
jgi:protein-S-isoprenylcysteine O-methyltransferase Ste14